MTQNNTVNYLIPNFIIKISNKNGAKTTLKFSSNIIGDSNDKSNFRTTW